MPRVRDRPENNSRNVLRLAALFAAALAGGRQHLVVLGFLDAFEHEALGDLLVLGFVLLGHGRAGVAARLAGVRIAAGIPS